MHASRVQRRGWAPVTPRPRLGREKAGVPVRRGSRRRKARTSAAISGPVTSFVDRLACHLLHSSSYRRTPWACSTSRATAGAGSARAARCVPGARGQHAVHLGTRHGGPTSARPLSWTTSVGHCRRPRTALPICGAASNAGACRGADEAASAGFADGAAPGGSKFTRKGDVFVGRYMGFSSGVLCPRLSSIASVRLSSPRWS
jgi:hypothetical protein